MATTTKRISLCWYTKTPSGWRYFPAQFESYHGMKQARHGWVVDKGETVHYPAGRFVLRSYIEGRKVYQPIETNNPRDAVIALTRAQRLAVGLKGTSNSLAYVRTAAPALQSAGASGGERTGPRGAR